MNSDWDSSQEINNRVEYARNSFTKYKKTFTSRDFNLNLKIRFVKCYFWSLLLYELETRTLKVRDINKLEAFELRIYRRNLQIPWIDHVTNEEVSRRVNQERQLFKTIKRIMDYTIKRIIWDIY